MLSPSPKPQAVPFLKWAGGKTQLLPQLIPRAPSSFNTYHEPFVGGGAMFWALNPKAARLTDSCKDLVTTYQIIKSRPEELILKLEGWGKDKETFTSIRALGQPSNKFGNDSLYRAARFLYLNKTCFRGLYRVNKKGQFNVPFGNYTNPKICDESNILACAKALNSSVKYLECVSYKAALMMATKGDFVFLDPPYLPVSKTSNFTAYNEKGFTSKDQQQLAGICRDLDARGIKFMLCNADHPWIKTIYDGFNIETVSAKRAINAKDPTAMINELIIRNYD